MPTPILPRSARALIVLGGALHPGGELPTWVYARVVCAAQLWHNDDFDQLVTSGGGSNPHRTEARALSDALAELRVPADAISEEVRSGSTLANAYYCRTQFTDPRGTPDIVVVTNEFHAPRVRRIFDHVYARPVTIAPAADSDIDPYVLEVLRKNEAQDQFLADLLFPQVVAGDLTAINEYLNDPSCELRQAWHEWQTEHREYREAREELASIVAAGPDNDSTG